MMLLFGSAILFSFDNATLYIFPLNVQDYYVLTDCVRVEHC